MNNADRAGASVIVPTYQRENCLLDCLEDLCAQDASLFEILVIDQSESVSQNLMSFVRQHSDLIRYFRVSFKGLPQARNFGCREARYPVLIYVDDDIRCEKDFVKRHCEGLVDLEADVLGGGIDDEKTGKKTMDANTGSFHRWLAEPVRGFESLDRKRVVHVPGGNFSTRREVVRALGGFSECLSQGPALHEETEFCLRAQKQGFRVFFDGSIRVLHRHVDRGGCRMVDLCDYVEGLARNRVFVIKHHLPYYYWLTAFIRLGWLCFAYALQARSFGALRACWRGMSEGWIIQRKEAKWL